MDQHHTPARAALIAHHATMNELRAEIAHCQLVATRLARPKHFAQQDAAMADSVAARNREIVQGWLRSALAGDTADVPLELLEVDDGSEERIAEWQRIMAAVEPALSELKAKQSTAVHRLMAMEGELPAVIDAVLAEDAAGLEADMQAHVAAVQQCSARLEALRAHVAERKHYRLLERIARGFAGVFLEHPALVTARQFWASYANALTVNPNATLKEPKP